MSVCVCVCTPGLEGFSNEMVKQLGFQLNMAGPSSSAHSFQASAAETGDVVVVGVFVDVLLYPETSP